MNQSTKPELNNRWGYKQTNLDQVRRETIHKLEMAISEQNSKAKVENTRLP